MTTMALQVVVIGATDVPNVEKFGESDPYAAIEFQGKIRLVTFRACSLKQDRCLSVNFGC